MTVFFCILLFFFVMGGKAKGHAGLAVYFGVIAILVYAILELSKR